MNKSTWILGCLVVVLGLIYFLTREDKASLHIKRLNLPAFVLENIDKIEILGKEKVRMKTIDGQWFIDIGEGKVVKADEANVESMLLAAQGLKHSHYVTNLEEKYAELGLTDEAIAVNLFEKGEPRWSLSLGKSASGSTRYGKIAGDDNVYAIKGSFWQLIRNGLNDWRDRAIFPVAENQVKSISFSRKDRSFILEKTADDLWVVSDKEKDLPKGFKADSAALAELVHGVATLNASDFVDDEVLLTEPKLTISLTDKEADYIIELFPDQEDYLVRRAKDGELFRISAASFNAINKSLDELRDFSLFDFDKNAAVLLKIRHGHEMIILSKNVGNDSWEIKEPKLPADFVFDKSSVDGMLSFLAGLDAKRALKPSDKPEDPHWQKNWLALVEFKNGSAALYATPNQINPDEMLVKGQGERYVINASRLKTLFLGIDAFKKEEYELPAPSDTENFKDLPEDVKRKVLESDRKPLTP